MPHPLSFLLALGATCIPGSIAPAQAPSTAVEWLTATELAPRLSKNAPWLSLIDRATLSVGRYRLAAGATDGQQPHDRDEVYYVIDGAGKFTAAGATRELAKGDTVFVAAAAKHQFHDITADLDLLVFFSSAVPATGGMAAGPQPTKQTPYDETSARGAARIFYWFGPDSAGQLVIDHGRPRWNGKYEGFLGKPSNQRWRFGENFWTTLDSNIPLELGGVKIAAGAYYLVLQHTDKGIELVLLDPATVRAQHLDAYEAPKTTGGLRVLLQRGKAAFSASRLAISFAVDRSREDRGELRVHFGPHLLTADLAMQPKSAAGDGDIAEEAAQVTAKANPEDVGSVDAICKALYDVISGPAGQKRDWSRMRSLLHKDAKLVPMLKTRDGMRAVPLQVEDYIKRSGPFLEKNGFFEQEIARRIEQFGDFAHVWSTYEGRNARDDEKPSLRGINSIQCVRENGRWFVLQILWEQEADGGPLPAKYLPGK